MSVIAVTWFRSQASVCVKFVVDRMTLGPGFLRVLRMSPCQYLSTRALYVPSSTCCCYQKDKREKPGNLPKCSFGNLGALDGKILSLLSFKVLKVAPLVSAQINSTDKQLENISELMTSENLDDGEYYVKISSQFDCLADQIT